MSSKPRPPGRNSASTGHPGSRGASGAPVGTSPARRPGAAAQWRARAAAIEAAQRREVGKGWRYLRAGLEIVMAIAIFVVVFAMLFPALRLYMEQQAQEAALKAQLESALHQLEESAAELKRWDDPAYIKVQARQRLSFAMPGDRTFRVSDPENAPSSVSTGQPSQPPSEAVPPDGSRADQADPWYAVLWRSMLAAGQTGQADQTSRTGQTGQR